MIEQALNHYQMPSSESSIRLLCMIAAHESGGFTYSRQVKGPALSLFQMEPRTFRDLISYCQRRHFSFASELPCSPMRLVFDPPFAAVMGRVFLLRIPRALPDPDDIEGLARYAKQYWNTKYGKATVSDYACAWQRYFGETA